MTLDPDVARLLEEEVHRQRKPMKQIVNDGLRRGLAPRAERPPRPYRVHPHRTELCSGVDPMSLNRLVDELEDEAVIEDVRKGK